jgi:hypothetical protein
LCSEAEERCKRTLQSAAAFAASDSPPADASLLPTGPAAVALGCGVAEAGH